MPGPSTEAEQARRDLRIAELIRDTPGLSGREIAEKLKAEGFSGCSHDRVQVVVSEKIMPAIVKATDLTIAEHAQRQFAELSELKIVLTDVGFSNKERVILALQILDREMDLLGTKAPTKSIHASVGQGHQLDERYLAIRKLLLDEDDATCREALELVRNWLEQRKGSRLLGG